MTTTGMLAIRDNTGWQPPTTLYGSPKPEAKNIFAFDMKKFHDKDLTQPERDAYMYDWVSELVQFLRSPSPPSPPEDGPEWGETVQAEVLTQLHLFLSAPTALCSHCVVADCFSLAYRAGPSLREINTSVHKCLEALRANRAEPQWQSQKLCAVRVLSQLYRDHGRTTGPNSSEAVQLLLRAFKQADATTRCALLDCLQSAVGGLGSALSPCHKDILKLCRGQLQEKSGRVRASSARCLSELLPAAWIGLSPSEGEQLLTAVVRGLDGADHTLRSELARLLCTYFRLSLEGQAGEKGRSKKLTPDDLFLLLSTLYQKNPSLGSRGGLALALLQLVRGMDAHWLETHLYKLIRAVTSLLSLSKPGSADLLASRKLVLFLLARITARLPDEHMQLSLAKHLCSLALSHAQRPGRERGGGAGGQGALSCDQAVAGCVLLVLGQVAKRISTLSVELIQETLGGAPELSGAMLTGAAVSAVAAGLENRHSFCSCAAVWLLQCLALSAPTHNGLLIDWALSKLSSDSLAPADICAYSLAVASLVRASSCSDLGLPLTKAKSVLSMSEDMLILESVTDLRAKLFRVRASWYLLGALISLGVPFVRPILHKLLNLWRSSFPHSPEELEKEKSGFDSQSLQLQVEHRIGALASLRIFLRQCPDLCSEEVTRKLKLPVESAIAFVSTLPKILRSADTNLASSIPLLKLRLYQLLLVCPEAWLEDSMGSLLREVVALFVQPDSLLPQLTTLSWELPPQEDLTGLDILPYPSRDSELAALLRGSSKEHLGSVENLIGALFQEPLEGGDNSHLLHSLPVPRATVDVSIRLFGKLFPHANDKHRLQLLNHFKDVVKQAKQSRLQAMLFNLISALLLAFRGCCTQRKLIAGQDITQAGLSFLLAVLNTSSPHLSCLSAGAIARLCQSVPPQSSKQMVAQLLRHTEQVLPDAGKESGVKYGYCLLLSALHKHVGMSSPQHLAASFKLLSDMAQTPCPSLQVSALYALSQMCDAGGPLFRAQIHPCLCLVHETLFSSSPQECELFRVTGQCLGSLIDAIGPEIQGMTRAKERALQCIQVLRAHWDPVVRGYAITSLQKALLFCPDNVSLPSLVPFLSLSLAAPAPHSPHAAWVAQTSVSCLRQCVQKDAAPIWEIAAGGEVPLLDTLIRLLDTHEAESALVRDVREILDCLQTALYRRELSAWVSLYQRVLGSEQSGGGLGGSERGEGEGEQDKPNEDVGEDDEDMKTFSTGELTAKRSESHRWRTQVLFVQLLRKLFDLCSLDPAHFDSKLAVRQRGEGEGTGEHLVQYLSELVRVVCLASTGSIHELRLAGLTALQDLIRLFSATEDPNLPGSPFLVQFQAQIGAAFRPAFQSDMPPSISALACQVCGEWIVSGVSTGGVELQKVFALLESSLGKVGQGSSSKHLYGDIMITLETLSVLGAWAEVYYRSQVSHTSSENDRTLSLNLRPLVEPHLPSLSGSWFDALHDFSLLSLPPGQLSLSSPQQCRFFSLDSADQARPIYRQHWTKVVRASALWLSDTGQADSDRYMGQPLVDKFTLVLGCASQILFFPLSIERDEILLACLFALEHVLKSAWVARVFASREKVPSEILSILHRLALAKQDLDTLSWVARISLVLMRSLAPHRDGSLPQEEFVAYDDTVYELLRISVLVIGVLAPSVLPFKKQVSFKANTSLPVQREILSGVFRALSHIPPILSPPLIGQVIASVQIMLLNFLNQQEFAELHTVVLEELKRLLLNTPNPDPTQSDVVCSGLVEVLRVLKQRATRSMLIALSIYVLARTELLVEYGGLISECSSIFSQVLAGRDASLILVSIEIIKKLYTLQDQNISYDFICRTAPTLLELVSTPKYQDVLDAVLPESVACLEVLLALAPPKSSTDLIRTVTLILISKLVDGDLDKESPEVKRSHQVSLQALLQIGPKYPSQFKEVMNSDASTKQKLEQALARSKRTSSSGEGSRRPSERKTKATIAKPLSIDFTKFQQTK